MNGADFAHFRWHCLVRRELWCDYSPFIHRKSCIEFRWQAGRR